MTSLPRFYGVTKHHSGTYRVDLPASKMVNEGAQFIGFYSSEEKAAKAYDRAVLLRLQKHDKLPSSGLPATPLNFPNEAELPEDGHDEICSHCSEGGELLLCENPGCDRVWHFECLYPPLKEPPPEEDPWFCALCMFDRAKAAAEKSNKLTEIDKVKTDLEAVCPHSDCRATGISDRTILVLHMQRRCTQIARLLAPASLSSNDEVIGDALYAKKPITARQKSKAEGSKQQQHQQLLPSDSSAGLRAKWGKRGRPPFWAYSKMAQEGETEDLTIAAQTTTSGGTSPKMSMVGLDGEEGVGQSVVPRQAATLSIAARKKIKNLKRAQERLLKREQLARERQQLLEGKEEEEGEGEASINPSISLKKRSSIKKRDVSSLNMNGNTRGSPRGDEDVIDGDFESSNALIKVDVTGMELSASGGGGMTYYKLTLPHSQMLSDASIIDEMDIRRVEDSYLTSFGLVSTQPPVSTLDIERSESVIDGTSPKPINSSDHSPSRKRNRSSLTPTTTTTTTNADKPSSSSEPMPVVPLLSMFDKDEVFLRSMAYIAKLPSLYPALLSTMSNENKIEKTLDKERVDDGKMSHVNQPFFNSNSFGGDNQSGDESESESLSAQLLQSLIEALTGLSRPSSPILTNAFPDNSNQTVIASRLNVLSIFYDLDSPMKRLISTIFLHALAKFEAREVSLSEKLINKEKDLSSSSSSSFSSSSSSSSFSISPFTSPNTSSTKRFLSRNDALHTEFLFFYAIAESLSPRGTLASAGFTRSISEYPFAPMVHPASIGSATNLKSYSSAVPIGAQASLRSMSDVASTFLPSNRRYNIARGIACHKKARPQTSLYDGHYRAQPSVHAFENGAISVGFLPSSATGAEPTIGGPLLLRDKLAQVLRSRASLGQHVSSCLNPGIGLGIIAIEEGVDQDQSCVTSSSVSAEGPSVSANTTGNSQSTGGAEKGEMFRSSPFRFGPGSQSANINQPPVLSAGTSGSSPSTSRAGGSGMMRDLNTVRERIVNEIDLKRRQAMLRSWGKSLAILKLLAQPVLKVGAEKNLSAIDAIAVIGETACREGGSLAPNVVSAAYSLRQPSSIPIDVTMFLNKEAIFESSSSNPMNLDESLHELEPDEFEAHHNSAGGIKVSSVETESEVPPLSTFTIIRGTPKSTDSDITEAASILRAFVAAEEAADIPSARSVAFLRRAISGADASQLTFLQSLIAPVDFDSTAFKASSTLEHKLRAKGVARIILSGNESTQHLLGVLEEKPLPGGALEDEVDEAAIPTLPLPIQTDEVKEDGIVSL
jgi:hypothetical protein